MSRTITRGILITTTLSLTTLLLALTPMSARGNGDDSENHAPVVDAGVDQEASAGDTVVFSGSFSDADLEDTHTVEWDFGDGQSTGPSNCTSHPVISEVFYDEEGTDTNEFVELYNPTALDVSLENWVLRSSNQAGQQQWAFTLPGAASIAPHSFYLLGQSSLLGPSSWGYTINPDAVLPGSMQNGPDDYLVLEDSAGNYVDGVRWGSGSQDAPTITDCLSGTAGAPDVSGQSVERKSGSAHDEGAGNGYDTNDNANDFTARPIPQPQSAASAAEVGPDALAPSHTYVATGVYTVTLTVTDNAGATSSDNTTCTVEERPAAVPPIPELPTAALTIIGLAAAGGFFELGRHRRKRSATLS